MAPFATTDDLGAFLAEVLTGARQTQAAVALEMATARIQGWTKRRLELVVDDVVTLDGTADTELTLPSWPVVEVTAIEIDGVAAAGTSYKRSGGTLFRDAGWGRRGGTVDITYTHGYDPLPDDIRMVAVQLAVRIMQNPMGIRQEAIGTYSVTYGGDNPGDDDPLLKQLTRYRRRTASPSLAREPWDILPVANA